MNPIEYLLNIPSKKIKYGLSRTYALLNMCGNPEETIFTIQIVGTNGKGSVSSFLANILQEGGYKIGLYTSPHLINLKERFKSLNGIFLFIYLKTNILDLSYYA